VPNVLAWMLNIFNSNFSDVRASSPTGSHNSNDWRTAPSGTTASWEVFHLVYGFRANLKTVKAQDEVLGRLLDTVA